MKRGFVYLCAILDWATRRVGVWRLSNTLTTDFCVDTVPEAITCYGSQRSSTRITVVSSLNQEFTGLLQTHGIQVGMDGAGGWRANVFVERLWRSLKYEVVSLSAYETVRDAQDGVARCMTYYNQIRPHRARDGRIPDRVYWENLPARPTTT